MPLPDDPEDEPGFVPPLHPDDRLWRHPSEMAAARRSAAGEGGDDSGAPPPRRPGPASGGADGAGSRPWGVAAASVVVGVAATLAVLAMAGALDRPVRTVIEQVDADTTAPSAPDDVVESVGPALVQVSAARADGTSTATGVVLRPDGHLLTTADAVDGADQLTVTTDDGAVLPAAVVGVDREYDLAVLDVDGEGMATARLADLSDLSPGTEAVAVARAPDGGPEVSGGRVAALGQHVATGDGSADLFDMIKAALELAPSSPGAVLCSLEGAVLGLVTDRTPAAAGPATTPTSLAVETSAGPPPTPAAPSMVARYATPIDWAAQVAEELIAKGSAHHTWLGVVVEDLDSSSALSLGRSGARVTTVTSGGPADRAGLEVGDVVVALDGTPVASMSELVVALRGHRDGDEVTLRYLRDGETRRDEVTLSGGG